MSKIVSISNYLEIDKILRLRRKAGVREFNVKWAYGSYSLEPENNLTERTLREYFSSRIQTGKLKRSFKSVLKQRSTLRNSSFEQSICP